MPTSRVLLAAAAFAFSAACSGADDLIIPRDVMGSVDVVGEWVAMYPANEGAHTEERMKFGADGSFRSETLWIGFYGLPADEVTGYGRTQGRYRMDGNRLLLNVTRSEHWQKYAVGPNPSVATPAPAWVEHGTLAVVGGRLVHTYVSAPADAPQTFTQVYEREK